MREKRIKETDVEERKETEHLQGLTKPDLGICLSGSGNRRLSGPKRYNTWRSGPVTLSIHLNGSCLGWTEQLMQNKNQKL